MVHCARCGETRKHLMEVRVYIYNPPDVNSFYEKKQWCINCIVAEGHNSGFTGGCRG